MAGGEAWAFPPANLKDSVVRSFASFLTDSVFVVALLCVLVAALIYAGLQLYGVRFYAVGSDSMDPAFSKGDVVGVRTIPVHEIQPGDVIAFWRDGFPEPIIHRVTRIKSSPDIRSIFKDVDGNVVGTRMAYSERTFWVKGDANPTEDSQAVSGASVVGKQVLVVPWPFNLLVTKFNRQALMVVGVAAIALFVAWEGLDGLREVMRRRRQRLLDAGSD